jgi:hypothetical protein
MNTSSVFLPMLPAATGEGRPLAISVGLHVVAAVAVVLATGAVRLSRSDPTVANLKTA